MHYLYKPFMKSLFIFTLFWLPIPKATADDLLRQVNQLQTRMTETNEKIATLASNQQETTRTISALQNRLDTIHQVISGFNDSELFKPGQLAASSAGIQRTANGHGRGGR